MDEDKMAGLWLKSRYLFYRRLLAVNLKNKGLLPFIALLLLSICVGLQAVNPILIVLFVIMYVSNCTLQYSKFYTYGKYVMYLIPLLLLVVDRIELVYGSTVVITVINMWWHNRFIFEAYQSRALTFHMFDFKNQKSLLTFGATIVFGGIMWIMNYYNWNSPVEEVMSVCLIVLIVLMEIDLSNNKRLVTKVRSRFDLVRAKSKLVTFNFLIPKHKYEIFVVLVGTFVATLVLGVLRSNYLTYAVLFIGIVMFFLYTIDYITQCLLLGQSIVYDNTVVKKMTELFLSSSVVGYLLGFAMEKYIKNMVLLPDALIATRYFELFGNAQIGYTIFYFVLIVFFAYRLHKTFVITSKVSMDKRNNR